MSDNASLEAHFIGHEVKDIFKVEEDLMEFLVIELSNGAFIRCPLNEYFMLGVPEPNPDQMTLLT
jgi:hypothetical protein